MRKIRWSATLLAVFFIVWAVSLSAAPQRFVDNGDGTITDKKTGLLWEKKTDCNGAAFDLTDPHCVNNRYTWGAGETGPAIMDPIGTLFTKGLDYMNRADGGSADGQTIDRKHYHDWRLPTITELRSIMNCNLPDCLDPIFGPMPPPDPYARMKAYWTSTTLSGNPAKAWVIDFFTGQTYKMWKVDLGSTYFRAVRVPVNHNGY